MTNLSIWCIMISGFSRQFISQFPSGEKAKIYLQLMIFMNESEN